jgi:chromosome segregation ATPase
MRNMYHIPSLEYFTIVKLEDALKKQLEATRRLQQELQQLQDETCLEVDEMQEIIDNQQEHIKQMTAARDYFIKQCDARDMQIKGLVDELDLHKRQLHNTLERKLQMSFELSAAQQEIAALKHSHSDACDMNRRLCLDW